MKALAIVGCPRIPGKSQALAEACFAVIAEYGIETGCIQVAGMALTGCTN
jgi:multimeric flavodoxin WrbA